MGYVGIRGASSGTANRKGAQMSNEARIFVGVSRAVAVVFQRLGFEGYQAMPEPCQHRCEYWLTEAEAKKFLAEAQLIFDRIEMSDKGKRRALSVLLNGVRRQLDRLPYERFLRTVTAGIGVMQSD